MLSGHLPQDRDRCGLNEASLRKAALKPIDFARPPWEKVTCSCKEFLERCLALELDIRPTANELLEFVWVWKSGPSDAIRHREAAHTRQELDYDSSSAKFCSGTEHEVHSPGIEWDSSTTYTSEGSDLFQSEPSEMTCSMSSERWT